MVVKLCNKPTEHCRLKHAYELSRENNQIHMKFKRVSNKMCVHSPVYTVHSALGHAAVCGVTVTEDTRALFS